jgi:hypothetical protein
VYSVEEGGGFHAQTLVGHEIGERWDAKSKDSCRDEEGDE